MLFEKPPWFAEPKATSWLRLGGERPLRFGVTRQWKDTGVYFVSVVTNHVNSVILPSIVSVLIDDTAGANSYPLFQTKE